MLSSRGIDDLIEAGQPERVEAQVTEEWVAFDWQGRRRQVALEWRPHPAAGSKAFPDRGTRFGQACIPETDAGIALVVTGSFADGTGAVVETWVWVDGPDALDPQVGAHFGMNSRDATTINEALDHLRTLVDSVAVWVARNRP